ncbi:MAG: glycosyltransferase [Actinobacteria bacterium]|nr:glycosyltransferase [Actinomycetota bacterium]
MINEKISVIIPSFNESNNIINTLNETKKVFANLGYGYEIIVVDDGSKDGTADLIQKNFDFKSDKIIVAGYSLNLGKGNALKYGIQFAGGDYILFMDADLDLHPKQISKFLETMIVSGADAVIGSKKSKDSNVKYSFKRRLLSNGYYYLIKLLFGLPVRDTQTGFKLFKGEALKKCISKVLIKRYAFDLELLIVLHKNGYKIVECPVEVMQSRSAGRIGFRDVFSVFNDTIKIFNRLYFRKFYD